MDPQELWLEVTDGTTTVAEFVAGAKEAGLTIQEAVKAAVDGWAGCFEIPEGETAESITAALVEWITGQFPFCKGIHFLSRFGAEWELLDYADDAGFVKAKRLEDGTERELHTIDLKCPVKPAR